MSKSINSTYGHKFLYTTKKSVTDTLKTASKRQSKKQLKQQMVWLEIRLQKRLQRSLQRIQKNMAPQIDKTSIQPTSIPKKIHISPERRLQIIYELRLL